VRITGSIPFTMFRIWPFLFRPASLRDEKTEKTGVTKSIFKDFLNKQIVKQKGCFSLLWWLSSHPRV